MKIVYFFKIFVVFFTFVTLWVIMFLVWKIHITSNSDNRYQIVNTDNCVILLDKRTGLTWRNVWNNNKEKIPSDWELMHHYDDYTNVPISNTNTKKQNKSIWNGLEEVQQDENGNWQPVVPNTNTKK